MYSFCSEFCILVSYICWHFIIFENWRKKHSDVATPDLFSSDYISLYIIIIQLGNFFKIVSYLEVYFMGGKLQTF